MNKYLLISLLDDLLSLALTYMFTFWETTFELMKFPFLLFVLGIYKISSKSFIISAALTSEKLQYSTKYSMKFKSKQPTTFKTFQSSQQF